MKQALFKGWTMTAAPMSRVAIAAIGASFLVLAASTPARADCQTDVQGYMKRRDAVIAQLNTMSGGGKKKQLDPAAACPKFRSLASILGETVAYLEKNKDWCSIPDQVLDGAKGQRAQFSKTAGQACSIAAKMKQAQKQAAQGGGGPMGGGGPVIQKLPSGPL
jgi:hypothetical protein